MGAPQGQTGLGLASFEGGIVNQALLGPNGSAAAPTFSFSNDPDSGMYGVGGDALGFSMGGTLQWYFSDAAHHWSPNADNSKDVGRTTQRPRNVYIAQGLNGNSGNQLVSAARKTGWTTATGTATRTTFATASVTLPQLAERVKALIDDLHADAGHGLISLT